MLKFNATREYAFEIKKEKLRQLVAKQKQLRLILTQFHLK